MREVFALAVGSRGTRTLFQISEERFRLVHVESALGFFFAGVHLEKDVERFILGCADFFQFFHGLDTRDGMDAVGDDGRLLELVALHGANHMATHAATVFRHTRLAELEFGFLHAVLAKVGRTKRNCIFHGFRRVELAHPNELYRVAAAARNLAGVTNPCFKSCKVLAHFFECEFHNSR